MTPAIRVENLGKSYRISHQGQAGNYRLLRESLTKVPAALVRRMRNGPDGGRSEVFWALKDVGFEVEPGEVVGIIGRNGAGKSTLLKILSRITKPTTGRVELRGRVGSLLEVGTGFHPELTGRENIYLNGSILGMSRREIDRKFDEIVAFSDVERFLDTPVKRYSSGMYVRLAFAVAAHLESEVVIVDEVLAVGDATYQKRCIDRMAQIARSGRCVLFVSHNMDLIPRLCDRAVRLEQGVAVETGPADVVVRSYLQKMGEENPSQDLSNKARYGDGRARFVRVSLCGDDGRPCYSHRSGDDLRVRLRIQSQLSIPNAALAVNIQTASGTKIHSAWTREIGHSVSLRVGEQEYQCLFRRVWLRPGQRMSLSLWLEAGEPLDVVDNATTFEVTDSDATKSYSTDRWQGVALCDYEWSEVHRAG